MKMIIAVGDIKCSIVKEYDVNVCVCLRTSARAFHLFHLSLKTLNVSLCKINLTFCLAS